MQQGQEQKEQKTTVQSKRRIKAVPIETKETCIPAHLVTYTEQRGETHQEAIKSTVAYMQARNKEVGTGSMAVRLRTITV